MKNIKLIYIYAVMTVICVVGCSDVIEIKASNAFGEDLVYSEPEQVEK